MVCFFFGLVEGFHVDFPDGVGAGDALEGCEGEVAGGDVEDIWLHLCDSERAEGGECGDEGWVGGLRGVDLVEFSGGGEDGGEDFAIFADGEVFDPGAEGEFVDDVNGGWGGGGSRGEL